MNRHSVTSWSPDFFPLISRGTMKIFSTQSWANRTSTTPLNMRRSSYGHKTKNAIVTQRTELTQIEPYCIWNPPLHDAMSEKYRPSRRWGNQWKSSRSWCKNTNRSHQRIFRYKLSRGWHSFLNYFYCPILHGAWTQRPVPLHVLTSFHVEETLSESSMFCENSNRKWIWSK